MSDNLDEETSAVRPGFGSMESALEGRYEISISDVLSETWKKIDGTKGTIWLAMGFYLVIVMVFSFIVGFILSRFGITSTEGDPIRSQFFSSVVTNLIQLVITVPLSAGIAMIGIKIAAEESVTWEELFNYFEKMVVLIATTLLMYVLIFIGFFLLIIPGIYLAIAYSQAIPLVINRGLSPWEALETSRKAVTHQWFNLFGLYFVFLLIVVASLIPFGLGLIWTVPMGALIKGIVYRTVFGYGGQSEVVRIAQ